MQELWRIHLAQASALRRARRIGLGGDGSKAMEPIPAGDGIKRLGVPRLVTGRWPGGRSTLEPAATVSATSEKLRYLSRLCGPSCPSPQRPEESRPPKVAQSYVTGSCNIPQPYSSLVSRKSPSNCLAIPGRECYASLDNQGYGKRVAVPRK